MVGIATAYGLLRQGANVAVLDEGDNAFRAARGNFGLVWFHGKGKGMHRYAEWTLESIELWANFATHLRQETSIDVGYHKAGGMVLCVGEEALRKQTESIAELRRQAGDRGYDCEFLDRKEVQECFPKAELGPNVVGASYSSHDGHVNPLLLLRAMHQAFANKGGQYFPGHRATEIEKNDDSFLVTTTRDRFSAAKVVLAAGHGVSQLAPMVDLAIPIRPERGQLLVTERTEQFLPLPMSGIRQTDEGSVMLGVSNEDVDFDDSTTMFQTQRIARNAIDRFPLLRNLRLVRTWASIRILTPDGCPVYAESESCPGAFAMACHSGVTLAAVHAGIVPRWILDGETPADFDAFHPKRFGIESP